MSKLLRLKQWVTLDEAARHLSAVMPGETVLPADILQLAIEDKITLTVRIVNGLYAREGRPVHWREGGYRKVSEEEAKTMGGAILVEPGQWEIAKGPHLTGESVFVSEHHQPVFISGGLFDLRLWGSNRYVLENIYREMIGSNAMVRPNTGPGVFLFTGDMDMAISDPDASMFQIVEQFDDNPYAPGSPAARARIQAEITTNRLIGHEAAKALEEHERSTKDFAVSFASYPWMDRFWPAQRIPPHCTLVVRTVRLMEFLADLKAVHEQQHEQAARADGVGKRPQTRDSTYMNTIAALLEVAVERYGGKQEALLNDFEARFKRKGGLSSSNLTRLFPRAKASLQQLRDSLGD